MEKAQNDLVALHDENSKLKSKVKHAKKRIKEVSIVSMARKYLNLTILVYFEFENFWAKVLYHC